MSLLNPFNWSTDTIFLPKGKLPRGADSSLIKKQALAVQAIYLSVFLLARYWLRLVTKHIQEPYLDEVFHAPQAQKYCNGDFSWDPMITTPPGLYLVSIFFIKLSWGAKCTVESLRLTNVVALMVLLVTLQKCRDYIEKASATSEQKPKEGEIPWISSYSVHTAVNICLFPPLFFFSGLYYTDVLSTCVVILAYLNFLAGRTTKNEVLHGLRIFGIGIFALFMRQTNIIWVAIFLAGLEVVRSCNSMDYKPFSRIDSKEGIVGWIQKSVLFFARGNIHDPPLQTASVLDFLVSVVSIAVAVIAKLPMFLRRIWPYIGLVATFVAFVVWNGSVVLGDKSHHVATLHLPQMLYLWPFIAIFSLPLIYPFAISMLLDIYQIVTGSSKQRLFSLASLRYTAWISLASIVALAIVHFNTIIHPFTLADNRHFVFYAFRYTIRAHPLVKYALVPIYIVSGLLVYQTLAGVSIPVISDKKQAQNGKPPIQSPPTWSWLCSESLQRDNKSSFFLIWVLSTALCLITAPLVEPRYFLISWILWRLHVPSLPLKQGPSQAKMQDSSNWKVWLKYVAFEGHDHRLWLETFWFLAINIVMGYILLFRGFEWPSEPGKVQRFMW